MSNHISGIEDQNTATEGEVQSTFAEGDLVFLRGQSVAMIVIDKCDPVREPNKGVKVTIYDYEAFRERRRPEAIPDGVMSRWDTSYWYECVWHDAHACLQRHWLPGKVLKRAADRPLERGGRYDI